MKEELRDLIVKLQVSNARMENLMNSIEKVESVLSQYKNLLAQELETSNNLTNKVELELLMDDAIAAQICRR